MAGVMPERVGKGCHELLIHSQSIGLWVGNSIE
jgi:hypothetical protein